MCVIASILGLKWCPAIDELLTNKNKLTITKESIAAAKYFETILNGGEYADAIEDD